MPEQKLTPEIPNARARTSVPTFIMESLPPLSALAQQTWKSNFGLKMHITNTQTKEHFQGGHSEEGCLRYRGKYCISGSLSD